MLTASGLSEKSLAYLTDDDKNNIVQEFVEKILKPAKEFYKEEIIYRYLLIKGDSIGGLIRNKIGSFGKDQLIRSIISYLTSNGIKYK